MRLQGNTDTTLDKKNSAVISKHLLLIAAFPKHRSKREVSTQTLLKCFVHDSVK